MVKGSSTSGLADMDIPDKATKYSRLVPDFHQKTTGNHNLVASLVKIGGILRSTRLCDRLSDWLTDSRAHT